MPLWEAVGAVLSKGRLTLDALGKSGVVVGGWNEVRLEPSTNEAVVGRPKDGRVFAGDDVDDFPNANGDAMGSAFVVAGGVPKANSDEADGAVVVLRAGTGGCRVAPGTDWVGGAPNLNGAVPLLELAAGPNERATGAVEVARLPPNAKPLPPLRCNVVAVEAGNVGRPGVCTGGRKLGNDMDAEAVVAATILVAGTEGAPSLKGDEPAAPGARDELGKEPKLVPVSVVLGPFTLNVGAPNVAIDTATDVAAVAVASSLLCELALERRGFELLSKLAAGAKLVMGAGSSSFAGVCDGDDDVGAERPLKSGFVAVPVERMGTDAGSLSIDAVTLVVMILRGAPRSRFVLGASVVEGTFGSSGCIVPDVAAAATFSSGDVLSAGVSPNCLVLGADDTLIRGLLMTDTAFVDS
uniref:Uncharacterized protein n=1 Tax=Ixodes ricinus TaxID=34613 RepID=A0A147BNR3_IXORI